MWQAPLSAAQMRLSLHFVWASRSLLHFLANLGSIWIRPTVTSLKMGLVIAYRRTAKGTRLSASKESR